MSQTRKSRFPLIFSLVFTPLAVLLYAPYIVGIRSNGLFHRIEHTWHDLYFPLRGESLKTGDPRLVMIALDDETVQKHGFPLPRIQHARALDRLRELGVKTVVFDVLFFEPREGDAELAAATKRHGEVIHLFTVESEDTPAGRINKTMMTVPPLKKAAAGLGSPTITQFLDNDGHVRRFALYDAMSDDPVRQGQPVGSVSAVALAQYLGKPEKEVFERYGGEDPPVYVLNYRRPVDRLKHEKADAAWKALSPEMRAKRTTPPILTSPYMTISLMDLLAGELTDEQKKTLKGALALIGSTTTGYFDHYPTPFIAHAPGGEYHLNIIDNVLNQDFIEPSSPLTVLLLVVAAVWLAYLIGKLPPAPGAAVFAATLALLLGGSYRLMVGGAALYPVAPAAVLAFSFGVLTVYRVLTEGAEKAKIKSMFGQFVSPEVVEELANDPDKAKLGAQKREMTVFFLDIAHFTTISEKMGPEALIAFLNRYLSALSDVILERRGTIDKYIGDCIMAFWNAPTENKDHAKEAILSALGCQRAIDELNKDLDPGLPEVPAIRIGINSGLMNVGFTGTNRKLAYTVLGDEVNLASRLEGANKFFGSKIIASEPAYKSAEDAVEGRYLGKARVVGKDKPVPVYEPLAEKGRLTPEWQKALPVWEKGVKAFYDKKYEDALPLFEQFLKLMPKDGPGELYLTLSRDYAALPPDDWDQVFNLTAK